MLLSESDKSSGRLLAPVVFLQSAAAPVAVFPVSGIDKECPAPIPVL